MFALMPSFTEGGSASDHRSACIATRLHCAIATDYARVALALRLISPTTATAMHCIAPRPRDDLSVLTSQPPTVVLLCCYQNQSNDRGEVQYSSVLRFFPLSVLRRFAWGLIPTCTH